jgi:Fe-S-cluster-containing dehydrogenase component
VVQLSLIHNAHLCVGCQAFEVACKQEHDLPVGPRWIRVLQAGPKEASGKLVMRFIAVCCMHCGGPVCAEACPVGAISRDISGRVFIHSDLCIGCKECAEACPRGAPQMNPQTNIMEICTLCDHRTDLGLKPACVEACPCGALYFGDMNGLS